MIIDGTAVVIEGDNIDTDVLYPGSFLNIDDPDAMKPYLFEGLDPTIRDRLEPSCVLVVRENFGSGSSREHVPLAMKAWGVGCVLGHSFARIFHRNCINLGLPVVTSPQAAAAAVAGERIHIDTDEGAIEVSDERYEIAPLPEFMAEMIDSGGLVEWVRGRLKA
ncbi:MAG: 3-isopropylmalate dehydratase small subunit [Actinomycetota bacterium]|nr:3-isopropylmalate dehydratase small subunit [Actinomycetota bacterium]